MKKVLYVIIAMLVASLAVVSCGITPTKTIEITTTDTTIVVAVDSVAIADTTAIQ